MDFSAYFSRKAPIFHGRQTPEEGLIVGYAAIVDRLKLNMPVTTPITLVSNQNKTYQNKEWKILPKSYLPEDHHGLSELEALYKHLVFALKYEGINLLVFSLLTQCYKNKQLAKLVSFEPTGQYSRRIWFLIEWISGQELIGKRALNKKSYVFVVDPNHQYAVEGEKSPRQMVINNLPGTPDFCPLIRKTEKLERYIRAKYSDKKSNYLRGIHKDLLQRTSAYLLLKDSRASFTIEGESPKTKRATRWGYVMGQAGSNDLTKEELIRLQQVVIENTRFIDMSFRRKGGFVGEHDRTTGEPIPAHISAKWEDIDRLIDGLIKTNTVLLNSGINAVIAATIIAFGFVFIHPFEDGNGRIHRYLIHYILAKKHFAEQGIIFPISASILEHIDDYRKVLESYSFSLLDHIEWEETKDHNITVLNNTIDYYRFFDATAQAEFLYDCVIDTIDNIIPDEVFYRSHYDEFKRFLDDDFEMPDKMVALLVRFLEQNNGQLSQRAREKEFAQLTTLEIETIESQYHKIFG